jgi:hypothetical protein
MKSNTHIYIYIYYHFYYYHQYYYCQYYFHYINIIIHIYVIDPQFPSAYVPQIRYTGQGDPLYKLV